MPAETGKNGSEARAEVGRLLVEVRRAHVLSKGEIRYDFLDTPNAELIGTFQLPEQATAGKDCSSSYFEFLDLRLRSQQAEVIALQSPGYAWMHWRCDVSGYPIGRPEFVSVKPLEP